MVVQEKVREETVNWVWARPLTFAEFVDMFGAKDDVELIDGVVVERSMVQLDHEKLQGWLYIVLSLYVKARGLGIVLGSRTAVEINRFRGRLPDLLFVREERRNIVQQKAVQGAPDLVIEIVSPNDRASNVIALETDYRAIGVVEIVFIDQPRRRLRILRKQESDYAEEILTGGTLTLETLQAIQLPTEWLFEETRPDERTTVDSLLAPQGGTEGPSGS
jgi:Uma2 family endonuclease